MTTNWIEKKVLEEVAKHLVIEKTEIVKFLEENVENPFSVADSITKGLYAQGLITFVDLIGNSCIAITQKGLRECGTQKD